MKILKTLLVSVLLSFAAFGSTSLTSVSAVPPNTGCFFEGNEMWCLICDPWGCYWMISSVPIIEP